MDYLEFLLIVIINLYYKYLNCFALKFLRKVMFCSYGNVNLKKIRLTFYF